ncbi:hypothetical protein BDQ17DRAFT_639785 [Cyathus striatus]|nr:hypothetical protein BDQ17DRAFT_639785 [Cyathus striatus]
MHSITAACCYVGVWPLGCRNVGLGTILYLVRQNELSTLRVPLFRNCDFYQFDSGASCFGSFVTLLTRHKFERMKSFWLMAPCYREKLMSSALLLILSLQILCHGMRYLPNMHGACRETRRIFIFSTLPTANSNLSDKILRCSVEKTYNSRVKVHPSVDLIFTGYFFRTRDEKHVDISLVSALPTAHSSFQIQQICKLLVCRKTMPTRKSSFVGSSSESSSFRSNDPARASSSQSAAAYSSTGGC